MLDKAQLVELFDHLGTPRAGRRLVEKARGEAPVRQVKSRGGNVLTILASQKMARDIRTESRHIEFAAAVNHEHDLGVLEYYPQPCNLDLELLETASGEVHRIHHFPDFLVIRERGITLEEWKSDVKLARLAEKYPYRYEKDDDGQWRAPQIERQLADLGIRYRILTDESIPRRRVENLLHLADYLHPAAEPCDEHELLRLRAALAEHGSLYLVELMQEPYRFSPDFLYKAVADQHVVADLDREALTNPRASRLFRDATLRDFMARDVPVGRVPGQEAFVLNVAEGSRFRYDGQELTVSLVSEREVVCTIGAGGCRTTSLARGWLTTAFENGQLVPLDGGAQISLDLTRYTQDQLDDALRRDAILKGDVKNSLASERTQRRWRGQQQAVAANGGNEILALVPRHHAKGNRSPRLSDEQEALLGQVIQQHWRSHEAINYKSCYRTLCVTFVAAKLKVPSYPTLIARIKDRETSHDQRIRHGKRMAYQLGEFVDVLYVDTPVHGSRPFQYVHIDHTQLDIELVSSRTGKPLGRPWFTLVVDAFSRRVLAIHLTFDPPSYHSVMMAVRDMVRRFGRLPEFVVVDNGRDFQSTAFESFLQVMGVHLRFRPAGQPRHGAVLERLFGRVHSEYVHNLAGNTKATKNVRMTTGKHLPVNFAEWTLESMYHGLEHWATEYYEKERHPALDCSPREMFQRGVKDSGARPQRQILFNRDFLIATCPPVDREGIRLVNNQRGVKVNGMFYWNPEFRNPRVASQRVPVRYDPWDAGSVYVRINNSQWVQAICRNLARLGQLTDAELRSMTQEYLHRSGATLDDDRAAQRLREFMQTFTPEGATAAAIDRQRENKALYNDLLQLGCITPASSKYSLGLQETSGIDVPMPIRSEPLNLSGTLAEAPAPEILPDFDTF